MKSINFQCVYLVDDSQYKYTAFNHNGELFGFVNPPVRNFELMEWVDSVTGDPGGFIPFDSWDTSLREPDQLIDCRKKITHGRQKGVKIVHAKKHDFH